MVLRRLQRWLARGCEKRDQQTELSADGSSVFLQGNESMWLVVGLGNPGAKYAKNRHNVGFMAVDVLADAAGLAGKFRSKFHGESAEGKIGEEKVLLLKPQTYMNVSGQSVVAAAQFYKIPPERIVVFHDEIDIAPNSVRVKIGGGNAGHNGLKSIQENLGTAEYWRVRIGIGRSRFGQDVSDYVLSDFSKEEGLWLAPLLEDMVKSINIFFKNNSKEYEKKLNQEISKRAAVKKEESHGI